MGKWKKIFLVLFYKSYLFESCHCTSVKTSKGTVLLFRYLETKGKE